MTKRIKSDCEEIQLQDNSKECILNENKVCVSSTKPCSKYKTSSACNRATLDNNNKKCLFVKDECVEIYSTCEKYQNSVSNRKAQDCEIIEYEQTENFNKYYYKCIFMTLKKHVPQKKKNAEIMLESMKILAILYQIILMVKKKENLNVS